MESLAQRVALMRYERAMRFLYGAKVLLASACFEFRQLQNGTHLAGRVALAHASLEDLVDVLTPYKPTGLNHEPTPAELEELLQSENAEAAKWVPYAQGGTPGPEEHEP